MSKRKEGESRRVLVTGSTRGIGRAIAVDLARDGFDIVLHGRENRVAAEQTAEAIREAGGSVSAILLFDISDRARARDELEREIAARGAFYGVVANAGIVRDGPFPGLTDEDWDLVVRVNLDSFYNVLRPLVMPMIQLRGGGRIVTLSSLSGMIGVRGQVNYSAAKAGVIGATKALSKELAKRQIAVNCVAPGLIETDMADHAAPEIVESIPMKRLGRPEEVSSLVRYLFTEQAGYITGQVISMNGGIA